MGARPRTVALFATCLVDTLFPKVGRATVDVLERLDLDVAFPLQQTCCGQAHINTGYQREAVGLVHDFVDSFADFEAVVVPSGSCAGTVRHLYPMVAERAGDDALGRRVREIGTRTFELSEYLVQQLGVEDVGATYPHTVTYHPTCHSLRMLRVGDAPLRLLRNVNGLQLVDLPSQDECCGFGGTFALKNADVSTAMLTDKMSHVLATGAEVCAASDSSCLMHIGGGLSRLKAGVHTIHLAEILASREAPA